MCCSASKAGKRLDCCGNFQDGVPMAIQTLRMGGIKVWMITGDKMETAINIGVSCKLVTEKENLLVLEAEHHFGERQYQALYGAGGGGGTNRCCLHLI